MSSVGLPDPAGLALIRSASLDGSRLSSPVNVPFAPESARTNLRAKLDVDFNVSPEDAEAGLFPASWSEYNVLLFGRANRVYFKNMLTNSEQNVQLCKVRESLGTLKLIDSGGKDQPGTVALGTSKGEIQIWDLIAKKMTTQWHTTGVSAMKWSGPVLTVGGPRGAIRHFDMRIPSEKLKESTKRITRHQSKICSISWQNEGKLYATGDESGLVHVWDARQNAPLDIGELIQRRKKIQHKGIITALAWSPWHGKILATGDSSPDKSGTIRIWNVNGSCSSGDLSNYLEFDAQVTSLHFSPHCKELLSTHGSGKTSTTPERQVYDETLDDTITVPSSTVHSKVANSVVVHAYPSLRHVTTQKVSEKYLAGSLLSPSGQRLVLGIPEESKLRIWDVWGKPNLKRQASKLSEGSIIR
ncbi:WD40 repeat-like protein [Cristinia sonorae]|uniref:WD40 repeat-like protein n=1 Tax=Cristinia sonorae TaxID=1940300 RepID=A0A8K0UE35_9AGAR|nr:WD40 repeat-like protein [Cristinia sonorae]